MSEGCFTCLLIEYINHANASIKQKESTFNWMTFSGLWFTAKNIWKYRLICHQSRHTFWCTSEVIDFVLWLILWLASSKSAATCYCRQCLDFFFMIFETELWRIWANKLKSIRFHMNSCQNPIDDYQSTLVEPHLKQERERKNLKKKHFQTRFTHRLLCTFQTRQAFDFICFRKRIYFTFSLHVKIAFSHTDVCIDFSLVTMNWQRSHERWHARKQEYSLAASVTIDRICIF